MPDPIPAFPAFLFATQDPDTFSLVSGDGVEFIFGFDPDEDLIEIDGVTVDPNPPYSGITVYAFGVDTVVQYGADEYAVLWGVSLEDWIAAIDPSIVNGSDNADVIDATYVDAGGHVITDEGQIILGEGGNDIIHDGAGADEVYGGSGSDTFYSGGGADQYFGGTGSDSVHYTNSAIGLTIDLSDTANSTGIATGDSYTDIKAVHGSDFADTIIAGAGINHIYGEAGDDMITDGAGTQRLYGGSGGEGFQLIDGDGAHDRSMDFEVGVDQLDLSLWGVTSLNDAGLTIAEHVNGSGVGQGFVKVSYMGNEIRIDNLTAADIPDLISSGSTFDADGAYESIYGIRDDSSSRGVDLDGALIVATYADGSSESLTWRALDPYTNGGAFGADISMFYGFESHELMTTKLLTSLQIDLAPSSSVFDSAAADENDSDYSGGSTPGSSYGFSFQLSPEYGAMSDSVIATYSGIVNLVGSSAEGDLFTTMLIDFSSLPDGGLLGDVNWNSDIDTMRYAGDLSPAGTDAALAGDNTLVGTAVADFLNGSAGDDILIGMAGNDTLNGGAGADEFVLTVGSGHDVIVDFSVISGDFLNISAFGFDDLEAVLAVSADIGSDMIINLSDEDSVTVLGVNQDDLLVDDFLL